MVDGIFDAETQVLRDRARDLKTKSAEIRRLVDDLMDDISRSRGKKFDDNLDEVTDLANELEDQIGNLQDKINGEECED